MAASGKLDKPRNRHTGDYKSSLAAVFPALTQFQSRYFNTMCQKVSGIGQDLHVLIALAEDQGLTQVADLCLQGKAAIDQANSAEMDLITALKGLESQAGVAETLVARVLRTIFSSREDASEYFFQVQEALERETTALQAKTTKLIESIPSFSGVLLWEDTNSPSTIRKFLDKSTTHRSKSPIRAEIRFSQSIKTDFCRNLSQPLLRCPKETDQCRAMPHIDHIFTNAAICLSNFLNLKQILLYIKLHFGTLAQVLSGLLGNLQLKLQLYGSKREHGQLIKLEIATDKDLFAVLDRVKDLAESIASEGLKLMSHVEHLPEQLAYSARTCLPLDGGQGMAAVVRENRLRALATACGRVKTDLGELMEGDGERLKRAGRSSAQDLLPVPSGSELAGSGECRRPLQGDSRTEPLLYRFYHLKSLLLKQYQPQRLIQRLLKCRNHLETALLRLLSGKQPDLASRIAATAPQVHLSSPATASLQPDFHSYQSSWDLQITPLQSFALSQCNVSTPGQPDKWSESELTGSVESLSELVGGEMKKMVVKGLRFEYYPTEKGQNGTRLAKNTLNKQTKAVYRAGVEGWKQSLKDLTASEVQLAKSIAKKGETPWQDCLSPVFPAQSSPISSASSYLSQSLTPSKGTFRSSTRPKKRIDESLTMIESQTSNIALEKLGRSKNLTAAIRSTATGRRLEQEITKELDRLAPSLDRAVGRHLSATVHRPSHYLHHRLHLVQKDRSLSPFDKIKSVREEFKQYYETVKRPMLRPTKS